MTKIMVIDDQPDTVELTKAVLEMNNFEVIAHTNPKEALEDLKKGTRPDLIILDMRMPGLSGPDLCKLIREDREINDLKIVYFTASSDADHNLLDQYNVLGFILKPFDNEKLIDEINRYINI